MYKPLFKSGTSMANALSMATKLAPTGDALAIDLGLTQQAVSLLEQKETLDTPTLDKVAKALGVSPEVIKNFKEEAAINIVSSTLHDNSGSVFYNPSFNPIDKIVELYERMIKEKDLLIDKLLKGKN